MVGLGGLLLAVPHLFAIPILVLWVGLEKKNKLNVDVIFSFVGTHIEHH
jgi:ABC-type nitrate/sulfonate/bicarbonate transport system permease component